MIKYNERGTWMFCNRLSMRAINVQKVTSLISNRLWFTLKLAVKYNKCGFSFASSSSEWFTDTFWLGCYDDQDLQRLAVSPLFIYLLVYLFFWRKMDVEPPVLECKLKFVYFMCASPITTAVCNFWVDFLKHTERNGDTRPPAPSRETGRRTWRVQRRKRRRLQLLLQRRDKPSLLDENEDHSGCSQAAVLMFLHYRNWDRVLVLQRMLCCLFTSQIAAPLLYSFQLQPEIGDVALDGSKSASPFFFVFISPGMKHFLWPFIQLECVDRKEINSSFPLVTHVTTDIPHIVAKQFVENPQYI